MRSLRPFVSRTLAEWDLAGPRWRAEEATLAFVDLSGFTRLSERLSRAMRGGAEELNATISTMWQHLIGVVHAEGGDVLQFGGDALLVLFSGPDHVLRGARCLWDLQRTIRREGRVETDAGPVRLRMSAGLHTTVFHLFVAGEPHREIFVIGDAVTTTCGLESRANAGQVLVSDAVAKVLAERDTSAVGDGAHLLTYRPAGVTEPFRGTSGAPVEWSGYLPPRVLELLEAGTRAGEHRWVTMAFIKAGGLDAVLASGGPDAVLEVVDRVSSAVGTAAGRYDVTFLAADVAADGAKWLLASGAPIAHEDDEDRMLLALTEIAMAEPGARLQIGTARGKVFAAEVGHTDRRAFTVLGDATNLAARLQARARVGTVLASRSVHDRTTLSYATVPVDPFPVKGQRAMINAVEITGRLDDTRAPDESVPILGRDAVLEQLVALIHRERDDARGGAIELSGEAGIGKSRLIAEVRRVAADAGVETIAARSDPFGSTAPYWTMAPALRRAIGAHEVATHEVERMVRELGSQATGPAGALGDELISLALDAFLADVVPSRDEHRAGGDDTHLLDRRSAALVSVLRVARKRLGPLVFLIDDRHRIDDASDALVRRLAASAGQQPWAVVSTTRPGPGPMAGVPTVALDPLEPAPSRDLALAIAGDRPLRDDTLDWLVERSRGNPLFVRELTEVLAGQTRRSPDELPDSLERMVAARIDELPPRARAMLRDAAVVGSTVPLGLLASVLDDRVAADPATWAAMARFCEVVGGEIRFRDEVSRAAAYDGLANRRRRVLHAAVAAAFSGRSDADPGLLGLHYHRARRYGEAREWAHRAAESAQAKGAHADAAEHFERALDAALRMPDSVAADVAVLAERIGDLHQLTGRLPRSTHCYRLAESSSPPSALGTARRLRKLARNAALEGRYLAAIRRLRRAERALTAVPPGPDRDIEAAEVALGAGLIRLWQGRAADAFELAHKGLRAAQSSGDRRLVAKANGYLEMACADLRRPERAVYGDAALALYRAEGDELGVATTLLNIGVSEYAEGRWLETLARYWTAVESYRRAGDVAGEAWALNNIGEIEVEQGRLIAAADHLVTARRLFRSIGSDQGAAFTASAFGRLDTRQGRFEAARRWLTEAEAEFRRLGLAELVTDTRVRQMELALSTEPARTVVESADELADVVRDAALGVTVDRLRSVALVVLGDRDAARHWLEGAGARARALEARAEEAYCLDALVTFGLGSAESLTAAVEARDAIADAIGIERFPPLPDVAD